MASDPLVNLRPDMLPGFSTASGNLIAFFISGFIRILPLPFYEFLARTPGLASLPSPPQCRAGSCSIKATAKPFRSPDPDGYGIMSNRYLTPHRVRFLQNDID